MDLGASLEICVEGLQVFDSLLAFRVGYIRGWEACVALYLCSNGYGVMCVEEVVDCVVIGSIYFVGIPVVLLHDVFCGNSGLAVGFGILFICRLVEAPLHGLHKGGRFPGGISLLVGLCLLSRKRTSNNCGH